MKHLIIDLKTYFTLVTGERANTTGIKCAIDPRANVDDF